MNKYIVDTEWWGYSRGVAKYEIEAESEEDAKQFWFEGKELERQVVRDDTEGEVRAVTLVE